GGGRAERGERGGGGATLDDRQPEGLPGALLDRGADLFQRPPVKLPDLIGLVLVRDDERIGKPFEACQGVSAALGTRMALVAAEEDQHLTARDAAQPAP